MLPELSHAELRRTFLEQAEVISRDEDALLPDWIRGEDRSSLGKFRFFICGSTARPEIRLLAKVGKVAAIVDDFLCKQTLHLDGIPVIDSETWVEAVGKDKRAVSVVLVPGARGFQYFMRQCQQWGLRHLSPLQFVNLAKRLELQTSGDPGRFFVYGYEFFKYTLNNAGSLAALGERLDDEYSRISWMAILLYRLTLNPYYLEAVAVGHHFDRFTMNSYAFNRQFFSFSDQEVYVDGGTFTGDTIEQFARAVDGKFRDVYAFEPASELVAEIRRRVQGIADAYPSSEANERIHLVEKGLWDADGTLHFVAGMVPGDDGKLIYPQSGHFVDSKILIHLVDGTEEQAHSVAVPVTTIDAVTEAKATFIKLEIEGAELNALHGGAETIQRNRPQMALSIYHKPEDLTTITDFVLNTGLDYRLGFRQHNPLCPDAMVLYCHR